MSTPKGLNIDFKSSPQLTSPLATLPISANDLEDLDTQDQHEIDNIEKLKQFELLPTLYNLLLDVQTGVIKSKDFDNNAGSLRLKLITAKKTLRDINGINESVESRREKIDQIKEKNKNKSDLLMKFNGLVQKLCDEEENLNDGGNVRESPINEDDMEIE